MNNLFRPNNQWICTSHWHRHLCMLAHGCWTTVAPYRMMIRDVAGALKKRMLFFYRRNVWHFIGVIVFLCTSLNIATYLGISLLIRQHRKTVIMLPNEILNISSMVEHPSDSFFFPSQLSLNPLFVWWNLHYSRALSTSQLFSVVFFLLYITCSELLLLMELRNCNRNHYDTK